MSIFFTYLSRSNIRRILLTAVGLIGCIIASGILGILNKDDREQLDFNPFDYEDLTGRFMPAQQKTALIIYFRASCDYCDKEAKIIAGNLDDLTPVNVLFISPEKNNSILEFGKKHKLLDQPNVHFLRDTAGKFGEMFGSVPVPSIFIFDEDRHLIKQYRGETKIEAILHSLYQNT